MNDNVFSLPIHPNINKIYSIVPIYAVHKAFDLYHWGTKNGTNLLIWGRSGNPNQEFKFNLDKDLYISIEPLHCKGKVLDLEGSNIKSHTNIHLWEKNGSKSQLFKLVKSGENCYSFIASSDNNLAIDVFMMKSDDGSNVILHARNDSNAQKFYLVGRNVLESCLAYALKYSEEENPEYQTCNPNSANFCSQCLLAGGEDENEIWNKNSYSFVNEIMFREYFISKNVKWEENVGLNEVESGDIVYNKNEEDGFCTPIIVIQKLKKGIIYCGNVSTGKNKGLFYIKTIPGLLKTSSLFK